MYEGIYIKLKSQALSMLCVLMNHMIHITYMMVLYMNIKAQSLLLPYIGLLWKITKTKNIKTRTYT